VARPSDLTPILQGLIAESVSKGLPPEVAAQAAGITGRTYYRWMARGREDEEAGNSDSPHAQFCQAVKEAEATAQGLLLETIRTTSEMGGPHTPKWQAAAWILERRWPRLYSTHAAPESEEERELKLRVLRAEAEAAELRLKQARRLAGEGDEDPAEGYWDPSREVVPSSPDPQATGGDPGHLPE
jgi:hypothetical protein